MNTTFKLELASLARQSFVDRQRNLITNTYKVNKTLKQ